MGPVDHISTNCMPVRDATMKADVVLVVQVVYSTKAASVRARQCDGFSKEKAESLTDSVYRVKAGSVRIVLAAACVPDVELWRRGAEGTRWALLVARCTRRHPAAGLLAAPAYTRDCTALQQAHQQHGQHTVPLGHTEVSLDGAACRFCNFRLLNTKRFGGGTATLHASRRDAGPSHCDS